MELLTIESESLVYKTNFTSKEFPSTTEQILCGNLGEPSSKTKYKVATDSEPVPRGKGEKKGETPSEIEPETVCEQTEKAKVYFGDFVPIEE